MKSYSLFQMFKDIWTYLKPHKKRFFIAVFFRATSDISNLVPAFLYSTLVTILATQNSSDKWSQVWPLLIIWVIAVYYYRLGHDLAKYFGHSTARYAGLEAKYLALKHMYKLDLNWHELENSGNKIKRIDNANNAIKNSIQSVIDVLVENIVNIIGVVFIFFQIDKVIALIFFIYIIFFTILSRFLSQKVSKKYKPISGEEEVYEGLSFESINNIRTVKSLMLYDQISVSIKDSLIRLKDYFTKFIFINRLRNHLLDSLTRVMEYSIMFYLVYRIAHNIENIAVLVLFRALFWKIIEAIWEFTDIYNELLINKVYMHKFNTLMNEKPTIEDQPNQIEFPQNWKSIKLKDLSFAYGDKEVLKDVNLSIPRGTKIGIVGISGAGKSTFVKLILDLYENFQGEIAYDDTSLQSINRADYIKYVSNVSQDTELFNTTLRENILIGLIDRNNVNEELELKNACQIANLNDVIAKLPNGLNTIVGEKGVKLSGGERQRVGIARAVIRNPQIIVLDEATSHLDSESEHQIQTALDEVFKRVTAIVIAHRLSTLKKMDTIIVLDKGKVVEQGSISELIKLNGVFAKLWNTQNNSIN